MNLCLRCWWTIGLTSQPSHWDQQQMSAYGKKYTSKPYWSSFRKMS